MKNDRSLNNHWQLWISDASKLVCPADQTESIGTNQSTAMVVWKDPEATDGNGNPLEATCKPKSGSEFPIGNTKVVCRTADKKNLKASCKFEVIIKGK